MFEAAELGQRLDKDAFRARIDALRVELVNAQYDLRDADFSVVVLLDGDDRAAFTRVLHDMHDWMDGRRLESHAFGRPSDEERERPLFWRYWRRLPRRGRIGVFLDGWSLEAVRRRVLGRIDEAGFERWIEHVRRFEQTLADDGTLFVKLWFHLPKKELKKRLGKRKKDPWEAPKGAGRLYEAWDEAMPIAQRFVRETSTGDSPWTVIESTDGRYASCTAAETILAALRRRLAGRPEAEPPPARGGEDPEPLPPDRKTVLDSVDLSASLGRGAYRERLADAQADLARRSWQAAREGLASVLVLEGWDAAGKGGTIRRLTAAIDPRLFHVHDIAAPTEEERAHHYLWRFWRRLPRKGATAIFDRSWYGRVLVERVEALTPEPAWRRAYHEIRDFEAQLVEDGVLVQKFWLHIDPDEQLRRFEARKDTPYKQYKLTDEDYRNRERWPDYERAVHEMVARTSTAEAPWHLVPANDKRFARVTVIERFVRELGRRL